MFGAFDLERLIPEALLFQTGYLTIADVQEGIYTLDYPNEEVKTSFTKALLLAVDNLPSTINSHVLQLARHLAAGNLDAFFTALRAIFAAIPYDIETKRDEAYFHTIFYLALSASGGPAQSSKLTCAGRIDLVMELPQHIYIFEFKCDQSAQAALAQIRAQEYAAPYRGLGKPITLVGINFSTEQRNVAEWAVEPECG
ncbi:MAG TPA: PD-(D/E)XK nuclease domain-containing protein [Anaerolineae bacterium]|nr:PD-(D/E)XK nuclease domain-containing protein [Anaerolineae bacterium]HQI87661.1 PD-(D/E)XK nuclease domain-containing protein [Anaerolineae bacterium]